MITIKRYKRHWAVWRGDDLIAVTLYRKGAVAVAELANRLEGRP